MYWCFRLLSLMLVAVALIASWSSAPQGAAQEDPLQATTKTVNVELILDASGSMAEALPDGETRMAAAQRILREVIQGLPERPGVNVGLRVYGHLGDNTEAGKAASCRASELLVPISPVNKPALIQQIDAMQPTGWTPIAYSLQQAGSDFQPGGESITNAIVLVTDGEETCDPPEQACQAAAALHQSGVSVTTHVVGFALTPQQTEQVSCIAEQGGGQLFGADNAAELGSAIGSALEGAGVSITPVVIAPVTPPTPLTEIRLLAYHQISAWTVGPDVSSGGPPDVLPVLSDDGQRIVFTRAPGTMDPATPNRIFVVNADGSGEVEVDAYPSLCGCSSVVDISADGSRVVSTDAVQIRVANASGGGGRELLALDSNDINALRITADGSKVVFRIGRNTTIRNTSPSQPIERGLWIINADGSGLRQVVGPAQMVGLGLPPTDFFGSLGWSLGVSADGSHIVFGNYNDPREAGIGQSVFGVNLDGSGLRNLLGRVDWVRGAAISQDGATVAYVTESAGVQEAGVLAFDGSNRRMLTDSTSLHPGTGNAVADTPGDRIELSADGTRLLLGSSGLLYDTASGAFLALGVATPGYSTDPTPLVGDGLYRATMSADAAHVVYAFQPSGEPYQLARLDLNPLDPGDAPTIAEPLVAPPYVLLNGGSTATISARVSSGATVTRVSSRVLRDGLPDINVPTTPLLDDGATGGDTAGNDGLYTSNNNYADCCAVLGPRSIRLKAESQGADGLRDATAIDVVPFAVVGEIPAGGVPTATPTLPDQVVTPTPTPAAAVMTPAPTVVPPALTPTVALTPPVAPTPPPLPTTVAGPETPTPATPAMDNFIIPDPAECTTSPRSVESITALASTPDQAAVDALRAAAQAPELTIPAGTPADEATTAAVATTIRQMTACTNAGNELAAFALWTDDALRQIEVTAAPPPAPAEESRGFHITQVLMLPDGRALAVWQEKGPFLTTTAVQAFVLQEQDGRYLVDETFDLLME